MCKMKAINKMLAVVLAAAGFLPVVGASKDSKGIKRSNLSGCSSSLKRPRVDITSRKVLPCLWDHGMIRRVVYYLYSLKDVRNGILRGADSGNARINALRYLFLIINGETAYSDSAIESSYRLLDSDESTRRFDDKNLFSLLEEISQRYIRENFMAVANISDDIAEDEEGDLDCKQLLCMDDFVEFPRKNSLLVSVCRDEKALKRHPHKLKNFETLTADNGDKFDICFINPDEKSRCYEVSMWYIKHDDGRWYRYGNDCIKEVDEHEVFEIGSFTDGDFVYSKRV